jgi:hypothetical protein
MRYLILIFLALVACGKESPSRYPLNDAERARIAQIRVEALQTTDWNKFYRGGDFTLLGGLLCFSGDDVACVQVRKSLDRTTGQLFRNEFRNGGGTDFSRDQLMGWLAYLLKTRDIESANLATKYFNSTKRICPQTGEGANGCQWRPTAIHHYNVVAKHIGANKLWASYADPNDWLKYLEAKTAPKGYPLHLIAVKIMTLQHIGIESKGIAEAANELYRREPDNAFFAHITGRQASTLFFDAWNLAKNPACAWYDGWVWSRTRSEWCGEKRYWGSSGFDMLFMANLLLSE